MDADGSRGPESAIAGGPMPVHAVQMTSGPVLRVVGVIAVLLTGGCSRADNGQSTACRLEEADGVGTEHGVVELRSDASGSLTDTAPLAGSFTDESFGYVEGYRYDEGLDLRIVDGSLTVTVLPAVSRWYEDGSFSLVRVWERPAPECGRFATLKMFIGRS